MKPLFFLLALAGSALLTPARGEVVFESGFEAPQVTERTPKSKGGNIVIKNAKTGWLRFSDRPANPKSPAKGEILGGITNELAHSGTQSLFIQANQLANHYTGVQFASLPFRIAPESEYAVGLWARLNPKSPLATGSAQLFLKLEISFYSDKGLTQTGDTEYLIFPVPGAIDRPIRITADAWQNLSRSVTSPADARYMTITCKCESASAPGAINGILHLDDVKVEGPAPNLNEPEPEPAAETPAEETAPAESPAASPAPDTDKPSQP